MSKKNIKKKSRSVLSGEYARSNVLLIATIAGLLCWGICNQLVRYLMDTQPVFGGSYAAWEYLPAVLGIVCALLLLLLAVLFLSPMSLGSTAWFVGGAMGRKRTGKWIFYWLRPKRASKAAEFKLSLWFRKLGWYLLYLLPGSILTGGALYLLRGGVEQNLFLVLLISGCVLLLIGLCFALTTVQRYFLAQQLMAKTPKQRTREAIKTSIAIMEGRQAKALRFRLGFLPWFLACLFIAPIFYVWPYYRQACILWGMQAQADWEQEEIQRAVERALPQALASELALES